MEILNFKNFLLEKQGISQESENLCDIIWDMIKKAPMSRSIKIPSDKLQGIFQYLSELTIHHLLTDKDKNVNGYYTLKYDTNDAKKVIGNIYLIRKSRKDVLLHEIHHIFQNLNTFKKYGKFISTDLNYLFHNIDDTGSLLPYKQSSIFNNTPVGVDIFDSFLHTLYLSSDEEITAFVNSTWQKIRDYVSCHQCKPSDFYKILENITEYRSYKKRLIDNNIARELLDLMDGNEELIIEFVSRWNHFIDLYDKNERATKLRDEFDLNLIKWIINKVKNWKYRNKTGFDYIGEYKIVSEKEARDMLNHWDKVFIKRGKYVYRKMIKLYDKYIDLL